MFVGNEPNEHVINNNKDNEVAEATASAISIYPGQDCHIASTGILTGILVCTLIYNTEAAAQRGF